MNIFHLSHNFRESQVHLNLANSGLHRNQGLIDSRSFHLRKCRKCRIKFVRLRPHFQENRV